MFSLYDIEPGYLIVVKKDGITFNMTVVPSNYSELGCVCPGMHWWPLDYDEEDLSNENGGHGKIMAIYGRTSNKRLLANSIEDRELLWKREETEPLTPEERLQKKALEYLAKLIDEIRAEKGGDATEE